MKPRFTPALCEWLEGQGFDIEITENTQVNGKVGIDITIRNLDEKDADSYAKEMRKLAKTECTNG